MFGTGFGLPQLLEKAVCVGGARLDRCYGVCTHLQHEVLLVGVCKVLGRCKNVVLRGFLRRGDAAAVKTSNNVLVRLHLNRESDSCCFMTLSRACDVACDVAS